MGFFPGEIYWADLGGAGPHKVIVVSHEALNRGSHILVIPCTSQRFDVRSKLPSCVAFQNGQFGFERECVAQGDAITQLRREWLLLERGRVAVLDETALRDIIRAIGHVISAECEPV
jgi:mRNA-degrading endonuclease toxin of MazEF toxin-antitoxin module